MRRPAKVVCSFSGGRDSALACYLAKHVARQWNAEYRLLFIDTGIAIPDTVDYVKRYAEWLGVQLDVVKAKIDYWEGVKKWGYPMLWYNRWCYGKLKRIQLVEYLRTTRPDVVVLGIRAEESLFREKEWRNKVWYHYCLERGACARFWLPIYYFNSHDVDRLITRFQIPRSPVWRIGISGECLCMAGMPRKRLDALIAAYPEIARKMAEKDKEVQAVMKNGPAYPAPLVRMRITLHEYIENRLKTPSLMQYIDVEYGSCQGACMLPET